MTISVIDFYKKIENKESNNPFIKVLRDPTFYVLAYINGKVRELTLKMAGDIECPLLLALKDFELDAYRNYLIIVNFLLGENGERVRIAWGLTKEDFRELIFELYFTLVKEHATCGLFKKGILVFIGLCKFFLGRKLK